MPEGDLPVQHRIRFFQLKLLALLSLFGAQLACPDTAEGFAVAVRNNIVAGGNYVTIDSYDSTDPLHSTGGLYDPAKRKAGGDVASVEGFLNVGGAKIYGHVWTSPSGTLSFEQNNGRVGDLEQNWPNSFGVQPGWYLNDLNLDIRSVEEPFNPGGFSTPTFYPATNTYLLAGGNYLVPGEFDLQNGQTLYVAKPTMLWVQGNVRTRTGSMIEMAPNASLSLYVGTLTGAPVTADLWVDKSFGSTTNFSYYGLPSNTAVAWGGNSAFLGNIYAPQALLTLQGGGATSTNDFRGSCIAGSLSIGGHFNYHFDENFLRIGPCLPKIITQPLSQNVLLGEEVTFNVASAGPALAFQWHFNGAVISGATNSSYTVLRAGTSDIGDYTVAVSNTWGVWTSRAAKLSIRLPVITSQPQSLIAVVGGGANFSVTAQGITPLQYQWQSNGIELPGRTDATLRLINLQPSDFTGYQVCVTDAGGSVLSEVATLTQATAPTLSSQINLTTLTLRFSTERGPIYVLEYADEISAPLWHMLTMVAGTGGPITITDFVHPGSQRFYRIRMQ